MKIIMKRMYRTGKINDELFVYLKMLLEDAEWPFDHYSDGMFDPSSIEDQLFEEFEELEDSDSYFEESDKSSEENVTDEDVQLEPKKSEAGEDAEPEEITPDAGEQKRDESFMSSKPEDEEESEASGDEIEVIEAPPLENQSKDGNTVIEFEDTP